ncbi:PucR family transcriptional regulator [Clostridia bacterium]|nr:PucR family transcriptional regulator [Clostridia bacterium]
MTISGNVRRIIDDGFSLLGNPFVMLDVSYKLLAHTNNPVKDDPLWNELMNLKSFSHNTVDFFNRSSFISAVSDADVVTLLKSDELKYDRACGKFFDENGIQLGSITVVACLKPFEPGDFDKISLLCEQISQANRVSADGKISEQFFQPSWLIELLDGDSNAVPVPDFCKDLKKNLFAAAVDVSSYENTLSHLAYFRDIFQKMTPAFYSFIYLNNVVILMSSDSPAISVKKDLQAFDKFLRHYNIYAGISGRFHSLSEIRKYYGQAVAALNKGMSCLYGENIFRYETFAMDFALDTIRRNTDLSELCNPTVTFIRDFDKSHGTDYLNVLHIYLLNGKNIKNTCAQIGLTLVELNDKIRHLKTRFEINFDDGNQLSSLLLSIKILNMTLHNNSAQG